MNNQNKWQVPNYEIKLWQKRHHDWSIIIPVINEGDRIRNLLKKIDHLKINEIADVIIVDGGSTDNSLIIEELNTLNVRGLIVKTGPGKLSAQLRCAYAFVLNMGYKGVITIDGNDKDDPAAITKMITLLENGYDFIQASRYIEGGIEENTPISRQFAIRFIHAPLLSWSSGFKWTDTTQGYRAYSKQLLLDPNLAIFRNIFQTYELLAYLSYRAPLLKFKCIEIGTTRIYPKGEIPTKISSFKGNLNVFLILIKACFGKYN